MEKSVRNGEEKRKKKQTLRESMPGDSLMLLAVKKGPFPMLIYKIEKTKQNLITDSDYKSEGFVFL